MKIKKLQKKDNLLNNLIEKLEKNKKDMKVKYYSYKSKINSYKKNKKNNKNIKKVNSIFLWPIKKYLNVNDEKKGLTFKVKGEVPLISIKDGNIIYKGKLSSYGNILVIDHGGEMRSVFLGAFHSFLNLNDKVKKGQRLGHSYPYENEMAKIYFEVRYKNKPYHTKFWINKKKNGARI